MYQACREARAAGTAIEKLCEAALEDSLTDRSAVVRAARCLLSSVTRVLLLADIVVVKQLLLAKDKVARSLGRLESVTNFTEFVKAFSQFGAEMVELAHLTGNRQNDMKDERRRAQMAAARQVLERSTMLLLTSSKACLRHPDSNSSRENRDTVFCQMRRAMDLIHYVVKDGVLDGGGGMDSGGDTEEDWDAGKTVVAAIRHYESTCEMTRLTLLTPATRETLSSSVDTIVERTQDFTDSAYTSHEHRENILLLCDRVRMELNQLLRVGVSLTDGYSPTREMESAVLSCLESTRELRAQLQVTAREQCADVDNLTRAGVDMVGTLRNTALSADQDRLDEAGDRFNEMVEHILEVCKLMRHMAPSETLQVSARYTEINLRIYGPQVVTAAHTLNQHPTSKIAKENLEVFAEMWQSLMTDVTTVCKDVMESTRQPEKQTYMSLPRPGHDLNRLRRLSTIVEWTTRSTCTILPTFSVNEFDFGMCCDGNNSNDSDIIDNIVLGEHSDVRSDGSGGEFCADDLETASAQTADDCYVCFTVLHSGDTWMNLPQNEFLVQVLQYKNQAPDYGDADGGNEEYCEENKQYDD
ncbi:Rho protein signal transduction [Homalodisca vitripennis]|nr:Rho protein signal transduction [Homalodisca vitripennis]